jgi:2-polyprenyl-3-methyl-5-hydroxy-6-metoxy-1,4-benzoquinol methylase
MSSLDSADDPPGSALGAQEETSPPLSIPETHRSAGVLASLLEYLHACPVCREARLQHYCRVPSRFKPQCYIHYERCHDCGTVLRNPRLPEAYRVSRYAEMVLPDSRKQLVARKQIHYEYVSRELTRLSASGAAGRLLDFGCGAGGFLVAARHLGFRVAGLEVNRDLARHVEATYSIPVFAGLIDDPNFELGPFDVIASFQVFEHLIDPRNTLAQLLAHLAPGGLLLIEVPNLAALGERLRRGSTMDDSHLFYFNARSLSRLLREAGLEVVRIEQGVRLHRLVGERWRMIPRPLLRLGERAFSALGIRTGLTVIGRAAT